MAGEFARAATGFAARTQGRFDDLDVVGFARLSGGEAVLEVGVGAGEFLTRFEGVAGRLVGADITFEMLSAARARHPAIELIMADGARLPLADGCIDLAGSAQMLHHVRRPVPMVVEMRRVVAPSGRVLIVDQVASERYEEAIAMTELETIRDPSHAASRPPSALRMIVRAAGLEIIDERIVSGRQRLSEWMWPGEFPEERIEAVRDFIAHHGDATGMEFKREGDDWAFTRRRMMALAAKPPPTGDN
ncbi:MAG: class I SAM-dependent methyltransferase [Actinomycetota bacterium]